MKGPLREVFLGGSPRQRGQAYGESLRAEIAGAVDTWRGSLAAATGEHPDGYIRDFLAAVDFEPAIERWTPGLLDEVRGLAEGTGLDFDTIYAFQLVDEEWVFRRNRVAPALAERCSSFGVAVPGVAPLVAQNLDLPSDFDGLQVLLRVEEDDRQCLLPTYAGVIGLNGLNSDGVGVCVNTLSQLNARPDGLPVAFMLRGLLRQSDRAGTDAFINEVLHASGQNYVVGTREGVDDYECSAGQVARFMPGAERVAHANHPLVNADRWEAEGSAPIAGLDGSIRRYEYLREELLEQAGPVDAAGARQLLSTSPLCRIPGRPGAAISLFSTVMELGAEPVMEVAAGPGSEVAYTRVGFSAARP
jgi:isopenicillin-N N-acyltransferase-like protein